MKFAVALIAITIMSQSLPAFAQESNELAFGANLDGGASVNVVGGGSAAPKFNLTDEQKEKFFELKNALLDDIGPKKAELGAQKRKLKDLLTQPTLDRKAVQATQDKINALTADLSNRKLAFKMDVNDNLTADQKKIVRFKSMKKHHGRKGGGHHKMRRGGFNRASEGGSEPTISQSDDTLLGSTDNTESPALMKATAIEQGEI